MNTFKLIVSSPDGNIFEDEIVKASMRGSEGDFAILAGHIPFITSVKKGDCKITMADGSEKIGILDGGVLSVSDTHASLLSGSFRWK